MLMIYQIKKNKNLLKTNCVKEKKILKLWFWLQIWVHACIYTPYSLLFSNLTDAFIQSDLQITKTKLKL